MKLQPYLRGCLWAGGLLVVVLLAAGILWLALVTAGDVAGSQGAKGVAFVALVCLTLDLIAVVVLLALAEIRRGEPNQRPSVRPPTEGPRP
jgi:hypothetical protein